MKKWRFVILANAPLIFMLSLVIIYPLYYALRLSFSEVSISGLMTRKMPFAGLSNYKEIFTNPFFLISLKHTIFFSFIAVGLQVILGLSIALIMAKKKFWGAPVINFIILIPWAISSVITSSMWLWIFNTKYGALNGVLKSIGLIDEYISFLANPPLAMFAVITAHVWRVVPFSALLFYAGLKSIPEELYEVAEIDGASSWSKFWNITLPLLKPALLPILLLRTMWAIRIFDEVYILTRGGPGESTWMMAWFTYIFSFQYFKFGVGAAAGYIIFAFTMLISILYIKLLYRESEF